MPPFSHAKTLVSSARSRGMKRRVKGEGETKNEGEGQPPCSQSVMPSNRSHLFCCFMGGVDPKLRIHFPPRHFPDCRDGGAVDKAWVFRTVRVRSSAKPARKYRQKADKKKECQQERRQGHRNGNAHREDSLVKVTSQRPSPLYCGG
ncbi:hypothetical protein GGI35DRAFT_408048 [Trichoderma velutinum]